MRISPFFQRILGGTVATLTIVVGSLVILGWVLPQHFPSFFRWAAGSVLVLYGMYRTVLLFIDWRKIFGRNDGADSRSAGG